MNLRQVEAFRAVMTTGSMTAAAELMSVTQPAVSRLIRDFEAATKLLLFERHGNQIIPTQAAFTLIKEVTRSFVGLDRLTQMAADISRHSAGSLRIAAMPALASGILPRFVAQFVADKPNLYVALTGLISPQVIESVASGQADLGYADGPIDRPGFDVAMQPIAAVVALPDGHPLAAKSVIYPDDLIGQRMIALEPGSLFAMRVEVALAGVPRTVTLEALLSHTALIMVVAGAGITIIDPSATLDFLGKGITIRPFGVFIDASFAELRQSGRNRSAIVDLFRKQFMEWHNELIQQTGQDLSPPQ
ncbi:LysR family transcriptional regulator [Pseudomonas typographi]|uniref:LysR family transcriptional regulator n=1 Tax=Pseudomonas typographi TaxID=2715964 RepID=A0ABR7Z1T7_9PSED|nr:LysR family transcriptional regulator [Pseudomonas typographi]MBD1551557.1 LysR family transcriptional regulator [Pseudomonas typographi]MBD1587457.1 LysR family transcriptional regulator [Pseudomonas typographi]MBD1599461.1 LysR family transcriptional regulator [Pseudomonas typographi]